MKSTSKLLHDTLIAVVIGAKSNMIIKELVILIYSLNSPDLYPTSVNHQKTKTMPHGKIYVELVIYGIQLASINT